MQEGEKIGHSILFQVLVSCMVMLNTKRFWEPLSWIFFVDIIMLLPNGLCLAYKDVIPVSQHMRSSICCGWLVWQTDKIHWVTLTIANLKDKSNLFFVSFCELIVFSLLIPHAANSVLLDFVFGLVMLHSVPRLSPAQESEAPLKPLILAPRFRLGVHFRSESQS